ncbi:MAG TPA: hypothetical protein IAC34_00440 [Candidatus Coprenecus stercoripullorum]|nr:hypothetical protein [Candidatus Coprenecus stercoripullorum]
MRKVLYIILIYVLASLPAAAQDSAGAENGKGSRYEGSVSIELPFGLGLSTSHGVRFDKTDFYIGGMAGINHMFLLYDVTAGFDMRYYFASGDKMEGFAGMGLGGYFMQATTVDDNVPPGQAGSPDCEVGVAFTFTVGMGFKLRNGDAIDLALKAKHLGSMLGNNDNTKKHMTYPTLSIGYRF